MSRAVIVFSGFNQRAVVAFLRTLERNLVDYVIVAASPDDTIFLTDYKSKVVATRKARTLDLDDLLGSVEIAKKKTGAAEFLVAPSTEALNRFLLDNRQVFTDVGCEIPLVSKDLYEQISDKESFGRICRNKDILVPKEYEDINTATLPCVAKPRVYFASDGSTPSPILLFTPNDIQDFLKNNEQKDFYYQEFIDGDSDYLLYYFYKNGDIAKFSQRNLLQQPKGKSIIAAESSNIHAETVSEAYENLFKEIGYVGLVMVELRFCDGRYYMIEANPRFWGPSQLFVDAGQNLFEDFLVDNGMLEKKSQNQPKSQKYFWHGGYQEAANQIVYHTITKADFDQQFSSWLSADIYIREDTHDLYKTELEANS